MKYDWRKVEKALYLPGAAPARVTVPRQRFLIIDGAGDPNGPDFEARIGALYSIYYGIRMLPKKGITPEGYVEYDRFPLEAVWTSEVAPVPGAALDKNTFRYRLMLRQLDFVTGPLFEAARAEAARKKPDLPCAAVVLEDLVEDLCVHAMHTGPYDAEAATFARMDAFCEAEGLVRARPGYHREIYISDPRKGDPTRMRTVLRFEVSAG